MYRVTFKNAVVSDSGYGLVINGRFLEDILSVVLDTKAGREFYSNCCNVTVIIDPQPCSAEFEDSEKFYTSLSKLEESRREQVEKSKKTDPEE